MFEREYTLRRQRYVVGPTMSPTNALWRFAVALVATAIALQIAWAVIQPLLPMIAIVVTAVVLWRLVRWHRGRW